LVLLGIHRDDTEDKISRLADKIEKLRIFEDKEGKMSHHLLQTLSRPLHPIKLEFKLASS
jgi:D-Tyr-tRNAtyr deacylase